MVRSGEPRIIDNGLNKPLSVESNKLQKVKPALKSTVSALKLDLSHEGLLNAIVMAEVLGKPKCLRKGRR